MKRLTLYILLSWTLLGIVATQVIPLALYGFEKSELVEKESETEKEVEKDDFAKKILFYTDFSNNIEAKAPKLPISKVAYFHYVSAFTAIYLEIASPPPDALKA